MKLTGKCKKEFEKFYTENAKYIFDVDEYSETVQNALIIEFFDSVGIYIIINKDFYFEEWGYIIIGNYEYHGFECRLEASNKAIIKANELFNENN